MVRCLVVVFYVVVKRSTQSLSLPKCPTSNLIVKNYTFASMVKNNAIDYKIIRISNNFLLCSDGGRAKSNIIFFKTKTNKKTITSPHRVFFRFTAMRSCCWLFQMILTGPIVSVTKYIITELPILKKSKANPAWLAIL